MKILLIGKTGQLGGDILRNNPGHEIYAPERSALDIESKDNMFAAIDDFRPDIVINTAAFHNVPQCETHPEKAFKINCIVVKELANICKQAGALFVTFSTDYIFGGEQKTPYLENGLPKPLQIYGISKLAGEYAALAAAPNNSIIIRTCGLYGVSGAQSKGGNFVDKRIADAQNHSILEIGCDQIVSPTSTDDLSNALFQLIKNPKLQPGIYHLVNEGECSWYDFTVAIYDFMGIKIKVKPIDRGGMDGDMRRPFYSALANTKAKALGVTLQHWHDSLKSYLEKRYHLSSTI